MNSEKDQPSTSEQDVKSQKGLTDKLKNHVHDKRDGINKRYPQPSPRPVYNNRIVFGAGTVTGLVIGIWIGIFIYLIFSKFFGS